MKVKKKKWNKIVNLAILYEDALEDIIYLSAPDFEEPDPRGWEWLARKRRELAEEVLVKGYNYEFGD